MMKREVASTAVLLLLCACGSSANSGDNIPPNDAGTGTGFTLAVDNFDAWCVVSINGGPNQSEFTFDAGTVVNLGATAASGFMWGYWTGTDGANSGNGGHDPNMQTTVTMTSNKQVLACCPSATLHCPN